MCAPLLDSFSFVHPSTKYFYAVRQALYIHILVAVGEQILQDLAVRRKLCRKFLPGHEMWHRRALEVSLGFDRESETIANWC